MQSRSGGLLLRSHDRKALDGEWSRRKLHRFVRAAWPIVEPGTPLVWGKHIEAICEHLEAVTRGDLLRLLINIAPGHMKSLLVSVFWPAWEWANDPTIRSQFGSYDDELAMRDSVKTRDLIASEWYQETFNPKWNLKSDQNTKHDFANTMRGFRRAFAIGGKVTGWRGDKVVVDDPLNARDQFNRKVKAHVVWLWDKVLSTRVNDPRRARFVVIMQRLAIDDLSGILKERDYEHLCLPSEFVASRKCVTVLKRDESGVPVKTWEDWRQEDGDLLFPEFFTRDVLDRLKNESLGSGGFAGQHQQDPLPDGGGRFKKEWFQYFESIDRTTIKLYPRKGEPKIVLLQKCRIFATADTADSVAEQADYTVYSFWAITQDGELLLLDRYRGQVEDPEAIRLAVSYHRLFRMRKTPVLFWGIEANGVGLPRIQHLQVRGVPVRGIHVHQDKMARSLPAAVRCEAGQIYFNGEASWLDDWERELLFFPGADHDDQVDTLSLAAECVFGEGGALKVTAVELPRKKHMGGSTNVATEINRQIKSDQTANFKKSMSEAENLLGGDMSGKSRPFR